MNVPRREDITGLVLAGGRGQRMDGQDKGLVPLGDKRLVEHVLRRFAPQVATVLISANRNQERYRALGYPVVHDENLDYPGPLAGILSGLQKARTPWLAVVPCDSPFIPHDLVARLASAATSPRAIAMVATSGEAQPVFALIPTELAGSLATFLAGEQRKITRWYGQHACVEVDFSSDALAFTNINTSDEHAAAATLITHA
jgi:molybdenum cofactor guanylyltransferase